MDDLVFVPAAPPLWPSIERLFRGCGDARHCWCAYWYLSNRDFKAGWGDSNRHAFKRLIEAGTAHGVLAMRGEGAIGWCNVAPRAAQDRLWWRCLTHKRPSPALRERMAA